MGAQGSRDFPVRADMNVCGGTAIAGISGQRGNCVGPVVGQVTGTSRFAPFGV